MGTISYTVYSCHTPFKWWITAILCSRPARPSAAIPATLKRSAGREEVAGYQWYGGTRTEGKLLGGVVNMGLSENVV